MKYIMSINIITIIKDNKYKLIILLIFHIFYSSIISILNSYICIYIFIILYNK